MGNEHVTAGEFAVQQRKQEVIRLALEGAKPVDIAALVNVTRGTVYNYFRDPDVRQQLAELNAELLSSIDKELLERFRSKAEIIDEIAMDALREMGLMIKDSTLHPSVRAKMIDSALDRTPELSRTKKLDVTQRVLQLKGEDLLAAAQAAAEIDKRRVEKEAAEEAEVTSQQNLVRD